MTLLQINTSDIFQIKELFLTPFCLLLIAVFSYKRDRYFENNTIRRYYYSGLWIRILFTFIYIITIYYYYEGGDTFIYYQAITDMSKAVGDDATFLNDIYGKLNLETTDRLFSYFAYDGTGLTHYYMYTPQNYMVPRFGLPFALFFGNSYLCISLCISFFAFSGCWRIFKVFYKLYPQLHKKIAIAALFLPSVVFWGVGLLKDSISIGALGFLFYGMYNFFFEKSGKLKWAILSILSGFLLYYVKAYIFLTFIIAFIIWLFLYFNKQIQDKTLRSIASFMFVSIGAAVAFFLVQSFATSEASAKFSTENIFESVTTQQKGFEANTYKGSSFEVGKIDNTVGGFLVSFPQGIVATLYRPFVWEVKSPLMILSALEALGFFILTLMCFRRIGFFKTFGMIFSDPVALFCFVYSVLFAGFVGLSTSNFGALVRYKIPCLAFYLMMLFIIMQKSGKFSDKYIFSKKLF